MSARSLKVKICQARLLLWTAWLWLLLFQSVWSQADPQGALDSFYVECGTLTGDTLLIQVRFASDNTDTNRIVAFGLPLLISVSNNALTHLDTTVETTYAGSMVSRFTIKTTDTDSTGGIDPDVSPVHFALGAVSFDSGVTGEGLFANLKLILNGDTTTVTVDTLSTQRLYPSLVTEIAQSFGPGWKSGGFTCGLLSSVRDLGRGSNLNLPKTFWMSQNYPNPFNTSTLIEFTLPKACAVRLEIYNLLGQKVATLVDQELGAGYKQVVWDGRNEAGEEVTSGVYFYRLRITGEHTQIRKMLLLR